MIEALRLLMHVRVEEQEILVEVGDLVLEEHGSTRGARDEKIPIVPFALHLLAATRDIVRRNNE